jgi:hypothetical protein
MIVISFLLIFVLFESRVVMISNNSNAAMLAESVDKVNGLGSVDDRNVESIFTATFRTAWGPQIS